VQLCISSYLAEKMKIVVSNWEKKKGTRGRLRTALYLVCIRSLGMQEKTSW